MEIKAAPRMKARPRSILSRVYVCSGPALHHKPRQRALQRLRQGRGSVRLPVHINMDEMTLRRGEVIIFTKEADLVAHARCAAMGDAQGAGDGVGKRDGPEVMALRLD